MRNVGGYMQTFIRTDQCIFGLFLASGDHNFWSYVLNPVFNYQGHRFLPPRSYKMKLHFFISEIHTLKESGPSQYFPIIFYRIKCESKNKTKCNLFKNILKYFTKNEFYNKVNHLIFVFIYDHLVIILPYLR